MTSRSRDQAGVYVNGVKVKDICSSPWGIGVYTLEYEDGPESIYGYPPVSMNPHDFEPDTECCTPEEIAEWEAACVQWDSDES
jgi:hypothetical protein